MAKSNPPAVALLTLALFGCANISKPKDSSIPSQTISAKVISMDAIGVMVGDLQVDFLSYAVELIETPGQVFRIVAEQGICPAVMNPNEVYRFSIAPHAFYFSVRRNTDDYTHTSGWLITSCSREQIGQN